MQIEHKGYHGESYANTVLPEFLLINEEPFLNINDKYNELDLARDDKQYYFYGTRALQSSSSLPSSPASSGLASVESAKQIIDKIQILRQSLQSSHFASGLSTWGTQLNELEAQVRQLSEDNVILPTADVVLKEVDHHSDNFNRSSNSP